MKIINNVGVLLAGLVLFGCGSATTSKYDTQNVAISGQRAVVELITELEDCKIYYVNLEQSPNLYMAKCGPGTSTMTRWSSGKSSTTMITTEDQETLKKAEQIKKRQAFLEKLSAEEKEWLNLPTTPQIPVKK